MEHQLAGLRHVSAHETLGEDWHRWPVVLRLLAENVARTAEEPDRSRMLDSLRRWIGARTSDEEIHFLPGRLLMHDTTSTPALVDVAALRDAVAAAGGDPETLSPRLPVEVSVDHSLAVESWARADAPERNLKEEVRRNRERYGFLRWASGAMDGLHINPPGTGIMHTINLEQLATVVTTEERDGQRWAVPDMMLGTDSHTPMVNALGVLGWGVGGLEAETVMFGMPTALKIPDVVGVRLTGRLGPGATATDLALVLTQRLRELGVTGDFVEFFGPGLSSLTVGERAVVANMAPEYGATTGYFPVDRQTLDYLAATGRSQDAVDLVAAGARACGLWHDPQAAEPEYTRTLALDLGTVETSVAGPRRPQDRLPAAQAPASLAPFAPDPSPAAGRPSGMPEFPVAIASITSCTNTTDPRLLVAAGLVARRARAFGLRPASWTKTSLAPGSPAAMSYLRRAGLLEDLGAVGFDVVGFGCATCIGNSGALPPAIEEARATGTIRPVAMLSGNRNFPGRIHPDLDLGFLMSPPLVVAAALAGDAARDLTREPLGRAHDGRDVFLADLWPAPAEIDAALAQGLDPQDFSRDFQAASRNRMWDAIDVPAGALFPWDEHSTTLRPPPFASEEVGPRLESWSAHPLLVLGDDVTTDHISPASAIPQDSPVADFLVERGEDRTDLNVFASRRGNWEVMGRGGYYSAAVENRLDPDGPVGSTVHGPSGERMTVWDAAQRYQRDEQPVVVVAGDRYGMGSSRDWAAKVQRLLGVHAVLASSYERIHRSNLIGMGILPLLVPDEHREALAGLSAADAIEVEADAVLSGPGAAVPVRVRWSDGRDLLEFSARAAVETGFETRLLARGGVLPTILGETLDEAPRQTPGADRRAPSTTHESIPHRGAA